MRMIIKLVIGTVGFLVIMAIGVFGVCGLAVGGSVRAIIQTSSSYESWLFRLANQCSSGLWNLIFKDKVYLVVLQNNAELRATGGFMGSYARLKFGERGLTQLGVEDIYQPDGQLVGHVEPPYPIQEAFGQGWWKLRDSNWDPDFSRSGETINWFFEQGGEKDIDGIIAVNLDLFRQWLSVLGEIKTETYDETVTESNLYSLAQKYAESSAYSGVNNKRDFLATIGNGLVEQTKNATLRTQLQLTRLIYQNLQTKQILIWSKISEVQHLIDQKMWSGRVVSKEGQDYLYVVEDNLGANKANPLVERKVIVDHISSNKTETIGVEWENKNPFAEAKPPVFWGGDYFAYVRIVIPSDYVVHEVKVGDATIKRRDVETAKLPTSVLSGRSEELYDVAQRDGLQIVGFWVHVPAEKSQKIQMDVQGTVEKKSLLVRRQPGVQWFDFSLAVDGKIVSHQTIDRDIVFEW